jgi:hypothetical protein
MATTTERGNNMEKEEKKAEIVCRNVFTLARKPTAKQIAEAARARVFQRYVDKASRENVEIINDHAKKYFDSHPAVDQLLYETYISPTGEIKMSSRGKKDPKPEGFIIASCLKYRYYREKHTIPSLNCIGTRWVYNLNVNMDRFKKLPETVMVEE